MKAGDTLEPLEIPITRTLVVAGAVASRDYQDVHHDAELARAKGSPDIFMNILTTNGLVGRYITDRLGPGAVLRKVAIRLGAPNYPGDTMTLTGTVTGVDGATAQVRVVGANGLGHHVTGTVTVTLPDARPGALSDSRAAAQPDFRPDGLSDTGARPDRESVGEPVGEPDQRGERRERDGSEPKGAGA